MTIAICKECGKEVSTKAKKCPHCGVKKSAKKSNLKRNIILLIGFFKTKQGMSVVGLFVITAFVNMSVLAVFSFLVLVTALINIIYPLKVCAITERRTAVMLFLMSFILLIIAGTTGMAIDEKARIAASNKERAERVRQNQIKIEEEARCRRDVECFSAKYKTPTSDSVINECMNNLEELAEHDFKWDNGKFNVTAYKITDLEKGIIEYYGNNLKFQNGFGGWDDVTYTCAVDIPNSEVIDVKTNYR